MSFICADCINIESIKVEISKKTAHDLCFYCGDEKKYIASKEAIFDLFESRFMESVIPLSECSPMEVAMFYHGNDSLCVSEIWEMIDNLEVGSEQLRDDLTDHIIGSLNTDENLFVYNDGTLEHNVYESKWAEFIKSISYNHRFFNDSAKEFLNSLFSIIQENGVIIDEVIQEINQDTSMFRARVANSANERAEIFSDPANQLGPVPQILATDQRMTPTGISAFYASSDRKTCFSEVRAITGDSVMSAEFRTTDTLRLLDLRKLTEISKMQFCPLEADFVDNSHKSQFIKQLIFLLSKPASKRGTSTYLETQIIFEYLRVNFGADIHGLVFSSVQTGMEGLNVVLFPEHSEVQPFYYNSQKVSECNEHHNSEYEYYHYTVTTSGDTPKSQTNKMLKFVEGSIKLHYIKAVKTEAREFDLEVTLKSK
ncbi:RES domain-containing protein [Pseudoalteromonas sp. S1727]|uniref:RES family NAD+ phosphorylase n=1 Tax=Pseudoalteromonas sp. S1727 TaxID=2066514 RepID=UPI0011093D5C|nr:RES family NAD+ phosphorylase [Pseudoalteromonas sp. S1727]TMN72555.1 RES domain-containing protein [Pseudoalteromonas sp. S1727]